LGQPLSGLVARLGLSDDEALAIFELDALGAIAGEVSHRPEVAILDVLTADAAQRLGDGAFVVLADVGQDGLAVLGWRGHHREVADPGQ
jgi:hypothetical protein